MTRHVLVPVDESEQSRQALEYAVEEFGEGHVTLLHVITPQGSRFGAQEGIPNYVEEWFEAEEEMAERLLQPASNHCEAAGMMPETVTKVGEPAQTIAEYAEKHDVDHIVIGSHGRSGVSRLLHGSVAETVVRRATVPVTVVL